MNGPEGFLPKNQNFTTQVARILWYRPKVFVVTMVLLGPAGCGKGGQYTHDPAGDTALPYKHDPAGDTALPYKHDPAGDKALPYKHDPAGVS